MRFMVTLSQWVDKNAPTALHAQPIKTRSCQAFGAAKEKAVNDVASFRTDATHPD
jgi:hypothetical protein